MSKYIQLTPYIPNDEGYIQQENLKVYINTAFITNIYRDLPRNATRIEFINGTVLYVTEDINTVLNLLEIKDTEN